MRRSGKVQVVVRSRRVPVGTIVHTEPVYSSSGVLVGSKPSRLVLYGRSLDDGHRKIIEQAEELACNLGLGLEVVDDSRSGFINRLFFRFSRTGARYPSIVVSSSPAKGASEPSSAFSNGS